MGKTTEPLIVSDKSVDDVGKNVPEGDSVDVSHTDNVIEDVEVPNTEVLDVNINPSVEDKLNGFKDSTPSGRDVLIPSVDDSIKDTVAEGMDADILSVVDTEPVTAKAADEGVIPSVTDKDTETAGNIEKPTVGRGVNDTMDVDIQEVIPEDAGQKKKSKKRKHKKSADVGESSVPKKKLSNEERAAKKARKVEKRARRVAQEAVEEGEVIPPVTQPAVDDEWLLEYEPQGGDAQEEVQDSDSEDVAAVMSRKRKAKGKLRVNKNHTRVGNKRIPKNVVPVSTANVPLNSEEEETRWKFVINRRIAAEKMLSEATKKNLHIMDILEGVGIMPTIATVGPYYLKLVREFICNMIEDIDDHASTNYHKNEDMLIVNVIEGPPPGTITISLNLLEGTHVVDIPLAPVDAGAALGSSIDGTTQLLRDESRYLDRVIQSSLARKSMV
ncbi:hypothetical protein LIER_03510 [Lithospermum erythrorhizon]|uniref:Uncharacterized protein n=1 Tax=Lithospermum erythrorhizon TaxID=34254 RepID=A0AAV3NU65_LITER